jgi:hypothetical protein
MANSETTGKGIGYLLTEGERTVMQVLHTNLVNAKATVYDAEVRLRGAEAAFNGGLGMLATSHGLGGGRLTPDFAAIIAVREAGA